jgi:hypothetical protein
MPRRPGPPAQRNGLTAYSVGIVDDNDIGVCRVLAQRLPGSPQQQHVTSREDRLPLVFPRPLNGDNDERAAIGDHARKHGLADEA